MEDLCALQVTKDGYIVIGNFKDIHYSLSAVPDRSMDNDMSKPKIATMPLHSPSSEFTVLTENLHTKDMA